MADDYEDTFDLDDLSDEELRDLVRAQLDDYDTIDADNILVRARNGEVQLSGIVGTVSEREISPCSGQCTFIWMRWRSSS